MIAIQGEIRSARSAWAFQVKRESSGKTKQADLAANVLELAHSLGFALLLVLLLLLALPR